MSTDIFYWVMHIVRGDVYAIGPYKSREGAENRLDQVTGGQADLFKSFEADPIKAIDDYKSEQMGVN